MVISSSPSRPCTTMARSLPSACKRLRHKAPASPREKTPTSWRVTRAGLASGPSRLKMVRRPICLRAPRRHAHRGMMGLGEQEDDAGLGQHARGRVRLQVDLHAQRFQHIGGAASATRRSGCHAWPPARRAPPPRRRRRWRYSACHGRRRRCRTGRWRPAGAATVRIWARMERDRAHESRPPSGLRSAVAAR